MPYVTKNSTAMFKSCQCGFRLHVIDCRSSILKDGAVYLRRRYECRKCGERFSTAEFMIGKNNQSQSPGKRFIESQRDIGRKALVKTVLDSIA